MNNIFNFFRKEYEKAYTFYKENLKKCFLWVGVSFVLIFLLSAVVFVMYKDKAILVINYFIDTVAKDIISETGKLSVINLISNNLKATLIAIIMGMFPFVYFSSIYIFTNASVLGALVGYLLTFGNLTFVGVFLKLIVGILPHGIFELPAVILSFATGICLCKVITKTILKKPTKLSLKEFLHNVIRLYLLVVLPMLIIAGFIEVYITPLLLGLM